MKTITTLSLMKKHPMTFLFLALYVCVLSLPARAGTLPVTTRKTFDHPTEIQGYPYAKGYA